MYAGTPTGRPSTPRVGSPVPRNSGGTPIRIPHDIRIDGRITNLTNPTSGQDAATKSYVDSVAAGLQPKTSVRVATTTAGTLASSFENGDVVDGVTLATSDRILIKDQADPTENGIYTVNASGAPTRGTDTDTGSELVGALVFVIAGTTNAGTAWVQTTPSPITVGVSNIVWSQFSGSGGGGGGGGSTGTFESVRTLTADTGTSVSVSRDAISVVVENDPKNFVDVMVGTVSGQTLQIRPGESVEQAVANAAAVYAYSEGWEARVTVRVETPTPTTIEDQNVLTLPAATPPAFPVETRVNAGATISADVDEAVPQGGGLRLLGYRVEAVNGGAKFVIVNGDTAASGVPVEFVSVGVNEVREINLPWGGVDVEHGVSVDHQVGSFTLTLRTKVA